MNRRTFFTVSAGAFSLACGSRSQLSPVPAPQRGIAFDGYRAIPDEPDFAAIRQLGATHLALFPFGYMNSHTEPEVLHYQGPEIDRSLTDEGLLSAGRMAREAGLEILVIPTLADFTDGHWRGEVRMANETAWERWFDSYRDFLYHYADLATELRATGFSVGVELRETVAREMQWRETIAHVRERFDGWLTYAANWDDYQAVPWWDAVDLIGVQAYFELGDPGVGTVEERRARLVRGWRPIAEQLERTSETYGKRVLFTEMGYKSHTASTEHPWDWEITGEPDPGLQQAAYEAAFDALWAAPWFSGFYWWKWRPQAASDEDRIRDYTPQGKPAEDVVRRYYLGRDSGDRQGDHKPQLR